MTVALTHYIQKVPIAVYLFFKKKYSLILFLSWAIVHITLLSVRGVVLDFEAEKYIGQAQHFLETGTLAASNLWFYSFQILLLAFAMKTQAGFIAVYVFQTVLNGISTYFFFRLCKNISGKATAFFATLLLIYNIPLQEFNCYLQTESLFVSFSILYMYYLQQLKNIHYKNALGILLFLFILSAIRPNGLMLIPTSLIFLYLKLRKQSVGYWKLIASLTVLGIFLVIIDKILGSGGEWRFMLAFQKELVLCAGTPYFTDIKISANPHSIGGFIYYLYHNFSHFARLAILKTFAFWGLYREYFSNLHNLFLMVFHYPLYVSTVVSIRKWIAAKEYIALYAGGNILAAWLVVILTCDDVHNRFFLVTTPYFYLLSLPFLRVLYQKLRFQ